ncbi:amino acid ABC transporter substrate-binding protein [Pseudomonas syringae]|uniref:Amino acid ABC transporter substrate-binding protein n=1 Tax=Pseudomonas syringae TaxID=317 RepID=A0A244EV57_PSESX|nr:transporter substrate-binding domain-containing protein [Pseudomonas syringae]OUM08298.1 amino acid ABC transporter substrate-binding protein [Pseudomonas syringae]
MNELKRCIRAFARSLPARGIATGLLFLIAQASHAGQPPLRFAVNEGWTMPMIHLVDHQPDAGILFDITQSLAHQVGREAEYHVMPRLRIQAALEHGEVDIHCYSAQAWYPDLSGDYLWSLPILYQRDWLVASAETAAGPYPEQFDNETVGTVLGYNYPALQHLFDSHRLNREDARTQNQTLGKLIAGRYNYAVTNQLILEWTNRSLPAAKKLKPIALVAEQPAACLIRNNPELPVNKVLRTLVKMRMSGEITQIIDRYTVPTTP